MNAENPVQIDLFGVSRQAPKTRRLAEHTGGSGAYKRCVCVPYGVV